MNRKLDNLVSLGCLVVVATTFINCSIATTNMKLDDDLKVNLDAFEVRKNGLKRNGESNNEAGAYFILGEIKACL